MENQRQDSLKSITQDTVNLLPNRRDLDSLQRSDVYICILIFIVFFIAGTMQMKLILGLPLSLRSFTMPFVMASLFSLITLKLRATHRILKHERDQHEFVRAQVQLLNSRLKEHLDERTQLLISARDQVSLTQARADQGVMASGVVHDINNALMAVAMSWELLKELPQDDESEERAELMSGLDYALQQAQEVTSEFKLMLRTDRHPTVNLIEHLRSLYGFLARSMSSNQRLSLRWDSQREVSPLSQYLAQLSDTPSDIDAAPESALDGAPPDLWVPLSAGQATQIIMNLVFNARDALNGGQGEIVISVISGEFDVIIEVTDNGSGMPDDVRAQIFDPFYTTKGLGEGTGLGLHVINQLVERAHGSIEVESASGVGTRFMISLPLVSEHASE